MLWADSLRKSHDGQRVLFDDLTFTVRLVMQPDVFPCRPIAMRLLCSIRLARCCVIMAPPKLW